MIRKFLLVLLMTVFLAAGCSPAAVPGSPEKTLPGQGQSATQPAETQPAEVRTLVQQTQPAPGAAYPAPGAYPALGAYPAPGCATPAQDKSGPGICLINPGKGTTAAGQGAASAYPAPAATQAFQNLAVPGQAQAGAAAAFQDCAQTPGLVGCAAQNPPIKDWLAYVDAQARRLVGLDLETGQGWQAPLPADTQVSALEWQPVGPGGPQLLVELDNSQSQVFSADGKLLQTFATDAPPARSGPAKAPPAVTPAWQGSGVVRSPAGDAARLEQTPDLHWVLHIKPAQGEERSLPLDSNPGDILYRLRSWEPGGQILLAQAYFASNQAMTQGGELITIDTTTGAIQHWKARMPLSDAIDFAWAPAQQGLLAFPESGETSTLAPRLALLDLKASQVTYPLPDGVMVDGITWRPDASGPTFAVGQAPTAPDAQKLVPAPGIYQLDLPGSQITALAQTPQAALDAWPRWTPDGQTLLYARALDAGSAGLNVQVLARQVSGGAERVLVQGLSAPKIADNPSFGPVLLAIISK